MVMRRLFARPEAGTSVDAPMAPDAETQTIRRLVSQLDALPLDQRRFMAGFAYILGRAANADMEVSPEEVAVMERTAMEVGGLPEAQAVLVVEMARRQAELYGATEDYLVTREFTRLASEEQRLQLLRCCFAVGAADDSITALESAALNQISRELGFTDEQLRTIRDEFKDKFSAIQQMRRLRGVAGTEA